MLTAPDFKEKQVAFALLSRGDRLSFQNDNIIIRDEEGKIKHQSTCYRLFALFVVGHISISSGLIQKCEKFGFLLILLNHNLKFYGIWGEENKGNTLLRKKQYSFQNFDIAKYLVVQKIYNQLANLKELRNKSELEKQAINQIQYNLEGLENLQKPDLQVLLGIEGRSAKSYFQAYFIGQSWQARRPRVKHDTTNTLLDIGYTLLFNLFDALLVSYGFDVYQGVYHQTFYQRKSLVCDLIEPFRPIIDKAIRKAYNLNQINEKDFWKKQGQYILYGEKAKPYVTLLLQAILERKMGIFFFIQRYYRSFMRDKSIEEYPQFKM